MLIDENGIPVSIADLATQPGTDTIFGIQSPNDANFTGTANLYTISTAGVATLVGNTGVFFASIAFAPDGTLYMTSADLPYYRWQLCQRRRSQLRPEHSEPRQRRHNHIRGDSRLLLIIGH